MKRSIRQTGKLSLSLYFQNLKAGDRVAIVREASQVGSFPKRIQGKTGVIEGTRGKAYIVKLKDNNQEKRYIVHAVHLKKIE